MAADVTEKPKGDDPKAKVMGLVDKLKNIDIKALKEKALSLVIGPKDVIGIDIGSYAVKLVLLGEEKGVQKLKAWGHLPLEIGPETTPEERQQQVVNKIKAFMIQKGIQVKQAAVAVSGNAVIVRYVKFPLLTRNELRATIATEAEPFIPFDINEVHLGFHILNEIVEEGQKKMETVLVASRKEAVDSRVTVLESAGLKPTIIDVDSFAIENVHEQLAGANSAPGSTLYLNIGHTVTNLSIIEDGVTRVVRDIFISGQALTKAITKALQYESDKSEEAKKANGILIDADDKEKALQEGNRDALGVSQAVTGVLKDMVAELHRSVDFFLSQGPERSIGRIVLSGGSAATKNIAKHLTGELKVPVSVLDPFSFLAEQPTDIPPEIRPAMTVAVGLALRKKGDGA
jgi:type IV pilus assembly protein PilM